MRPVVLGRSRWQETAVLFGTRVERPRCLHVREVPRMWHPSTAPLCLLRSKEKADPWRGGNRGNRARRLPLPTALGRVRPSAAGITIRETKGAAARRRQLLFAKNLEGAVAARVIVYPADWRPILSNGAKSKQTRR